MPDDRPPFPEWFDARTTLMVVILSGVFSAVVTGGLIWNGLRYRSLDYLDAESIRKLKEELLKNPGDEDLIRKIRKEDLERRRNYFLSREKLRTGAWLLFGGLAVFVFALRRYLVETTPLPQPIPLDDQLDQDAPRNRVLTAVLLVPVPVALATLVTFYVTRPYEKRQEERPGEGPAGVLAEPPSLPENLRWTGFRGNNGLGYVEKMDLPVSWDAETSENILWKVPVPLKGNSSPIIWGDFLYLTGADADARKVFCFNRHDGSLRWECTIRSRVVIDEDLRKLDRLGDTGLASPTPVTDGRCVYAFFGTNELAAVDFNGRQIWSHWFGKPESMFGISSSPRYDSGRVLLQLDQGDEENPNSSLYALDPASGRILWKTRRDVPSSWTTPILVNTGERKELIAGGVPWLIGYDPGTGKEYWRAKVLKGDLAPLPVYGDGLVFIALEYSRLSAVRTGGKGDVTETHVVWTYEEDLPDVPSPVTDGKRLLLPTSYGRITCFDAKTGEVLWKEDLENDYWSSPTLVGDRVYMTAMDGVTTVFRLGDAFEKVGEGKVGERVVTSFALADSKIYVRGEKNLFCIGTKE